jgi:hypothetical protein
MRTAVFDDADHVIEPRDTEVNVAGGYTAQRAFLDFVLGCQQ